jgi:hypothetical protein
VEEEFDDVIKKRERFMVRFQLFYLNSLKFLGFFAPSILIFALLFAS